MSPNASPLHSRVSFGGFATPSGPAQLKDENAISSINRASVKKYGGYNQFASMSMIDCGGSPLSTTSSVGSHFTTPGSSAKDNCAFTQPPSSQDSCYIDDDEIEEL
jgi:hypothetical protein